MRISVLKLFIILFIISSCKNESSEQLALSKETPFKSSLKLGVRDTISSKILNQKRPIIISLPNGYEKENANYPVLYLTDGLQNIWHVLGTIEVLTRTGSMPPVIVVGIESLDRNGDFSPSKNENSPGSGGGPKYLDFMEKELIPYIESNYKTQPFRILEGHSLGGLFATYALMEKPELFNAHIIMSPSFWWNNEEFITKASTFFKNNPKLETALFFGIGTLESSKEWGMRKELQKFIDEIKANQPEKLRFEHKEMENEGHMSSPLLSNYYGLKSIFSDMALPDEIVENFNSKIFLEHENKIMQKYGAEAKQSAENYVSLAFHLINEKEFTDAITVLKRSIEAYSYDVWLRSLLANTYEKNKQIEKAIETYKEAVEVSKKYKFGREVEFQEHIDRLESL